MQFFYIPDLNSSHIILDGETYRHAIRVMRKKESEQLVLVDGKGQKAVGAIQSIAKKAAEVEIIERVYAYQPLPYNLLLGLAPTKNPGRTEWCLEKATEIGISQFYPFVSEHSERNRIKKDRLESIAIAAMKQSQQAYLPLIGNLLCFQDVISQMSECEEKFICSAHASHHLDSVHQRSGHVAVLIGPEGDFSDSEIVYAKDQGFIPVHLGQRRLRTETAGVVACTLIGQAYVK